MENMRFKVGDRVRIKSLDWYNKNKDKDGNIRYRHGNAYPIFFTKYMSRFCGETVTIKCVHKKSYYMNETGSCEFWTDEMIEGLVEDETKPKLGTALNPIEPKSNANSITQSKVDVIEKAKTYWDSIKDAWICPEGYHFKDENGNVINATKIVLEKKKKEYPKTYDECCQYLGCDDKIKMQLIGQFTRLINARNAYWKLYGEEMGLGKPWEPDYDGTFEDRTPIKYVIYNNGTRIVKGRKSSPNYILAFPTPEMRDAFKENFDPDIEVCKEFL